MYVITLWIAFPSIEFPERLRRMMIRIRENNIIITTITNTISSYFVMWNVYLMLHTMIVSINHFLFKQVSLNLMYVMSLCA